MTERRPTITFGMKMEALFRLGMIRCGRCGGVIPSPDLCEWNHLKELALGGVHSAANLEPAHGIRSQERCHQKYTSAFQTAEGKVRRLNGTTPKVRKGQPLRGAGFDKRLRRRMNGKTEVRA